MFALIHKVVFLPLKIGGYLILKIPKFGTQTLPLRDQNKFSIIIYQTSYIEQNEEVSTHVCLKARLTT